MIARISSRIVKALIENNIIKTEENEIYQFGIEMVISTTIVILIVLSCGIIFRDLISSIVFFIIFAFIRSSSGGYHADTYFKCNIIYAINLIIVLFWIKFAPPYYSLCGHIMFLLIYFLMVYQFSPIENSNKPLDNSQKKKHKMICVFYGIILSAISVVLWYKYTQVKYAVLITAILISVSISMAVEIFRKGGKINEKDRS